MDFDHPARDRPRPASHRARPSCPPSIWPRGSRGGACRGRATAGRRTPAPRQASAGPGRRRAAPTAAWVAAYLAKIPAAISGQRGHDQTFHAACVLVKGFGLTVDEARPFLHEWNERCDPPWSAAELEHKLKSRRGRRGCPPAGLPRVDARAVSPAAAPARSAGARGPSRPPGRSPPLSREPGGQPAPPGRALPGGAVCIRGRDRPAVLARGIPRLGWLGVSPDPGREIRARLARSLAGEFERLYRLDAARHAREQGEASGPAGPRRRPRLLAVTSRLVSDVLQALSGMVLVPAAACPARPAWLDGIPSSAAARRRPQAGPATTRAGADELSPWPVDETLPARNALVHLPTSLDGEPLLRPAVAALLQRLRAGL